VQGALSSAAPLRLWPPRLDGRPLRDRLAGTGICLNDGRRMTGSDCTFARSPCFRVQTGHFNQGIGQEF
jgi:hypothetical protein